MTPLIPYFDFKTLDLWGVLTVPTPGALIVVGILAGVSVTHHKVRRDGLEVDLIYQSLPWIMMAGVIGGHVGALLLYHPQGVLEHPLSLFVLWEGQSSFGGFTLVAVVGIYFFKKELKKRSSLKTSHPNSTDIWAYADAIIVGFLLAWVFGRLGCFAIHDHPGVETTFWLGVYGICPGGQEDLACHDMGLYEAIWSLGFFGLCLVLDRTPHFPGFFVAFLTISYGVSRFLFDMLRHPDTDARYFGLTPGQYGAMVLVGFGLWALRVKGPFRLLKNT